MVDYLTLDISPNKQESFIFSSLFNNHENESESDHQEQIMHNLLAVLYNQKESEYKSNLEKILMSMSSELYEKYSLKAQLNEQLVSHSNVTSLQKI